MKKQVKILDIDNKNKDIEISKLSLENETFKNNEELIKRNELIKEQKSTIKEQKQEITRLNDIVEILNNQVKTIQRKFDNFKDHIYSFCDKMCRALGHLIGIHISKNNKNLIMMILNMKLIGLIKNTNVINLTILK